MSTTVVGGYTRDVSGDDMYGRLCLTVVDVEMDSRGETGGSRRNE